MELIYPKFPYLSELQHVDSAVMLEIAGFNNLKKQNQNQNQPNKKTLSINQPTTKKVIYLKLFLGLQSVLICNCLQM